LTVGIIEAQYQSEKVTLRHGRFRIERGYDPSVRMPHVILKCAGFIGEVTHKLGSEVYGDLYASGFFVGVPSQSTLGVFSYFVTAKHVAKELAGREIYFLINSKDGGVIRQPLAGQWEFHPVDSAADVAVMNVTLDRNADVITLAEKEFISEKDFECEYGIGDEVTSVGLFTPAPGTNRNLPIIRMGNLAMIPHEEIQTDLGYTDVYLIEARSIGGLSGSLAWIRPSFLLLGTSTDGPDDRPYGSIGTGKLLGLMQGHWDIRESQINETVITQDRQRGVNMGIAIVVPASKILETINQPKLIEQRKLADDLERKRNVPGLDSGKRGNEDAIFTSRDFEAALKKVSRKLVPNQNK
jgi:hypothetical protein